MRRFFDARANVNERTIVSFSTTDIVLLSAFLRWTIEYGERHASIDLRIKAKEFLDLIDTSYQDITHTPSGYIVCDDVFPADIPKSDR